MRSQVAAILIFAATMVCGAGRATTQTVPIVSVCDLLADRDKYDGRTVAVIALATATDEGIWLRGQLCQTHVRTDDYVWPDTVVLSFDPSRSQTIASGFHIDQRELLARVAALSPSQSEQDTEPVLVVGRVEAGTLAVVQFDDGTLHGAGYGHLNAAPIALHYRESDYHHIVDGKLTPPL